MRGARLSLTPDIGWTRARMAQQTAAIWTDYARLTFETFAAARSPSPGNCVAYRSSLHNLLSREECGTLVKLLDEKRGIAQKPLIIRREDDSPGHKAQGPIIVSTLPALSQQSALLDRFRDSLLEHVCFGNTDTVFQLGDASLITFLPAGLFAQVVCSAPNYANCLEFMTRKQKHSSAVWNALFKLEVLNGGDGFAADDFLPGIAEKTAKTSRDAKFRKAGIDSDLMYGLKITPRSSVTLGDVSILTHAPEGEEDALLKFVFWMSETAKLKKKDKLSAVLQSWFPNTSLATECEAGKLSPKDFVNLFQAALPLFKDGESPFLQAFKTFTSSFEVEGEEEYFD
uniref:HECT domain-containing protein n=1 Tax=Steinernema glaseri TaxID=37863 RepID=A0A1I7ZVF6_9BILA